jgi:2-dehydro-3-deoxyphosphogluconate aldolase/(4S)-4-hydroxy-2-oxoglutarate aldolase
LILRRRAAAWKAGADFVKVFPCSLLGGPSYIRTLRLQLPHVPLIASGGVTHGNTAEFILAGVAGVGIGRDLINLEAVHRREVDWIRELAGRFLQIVSEARSQYLTPQ